MSTKAKKKKRHQKRKCIFYQQQPSRARRLTNYLCAGDNVWPACAHQPQCLAEPPEETEDE